MQSARTWPWCLLPIASSLEQITVRSFEFLFLMCFSRRLRITRILLSTLRRPPPSPPHCKNLRFVRAILSRFSPKLFIIVKFVSRLLFRIDRIAKTWVRWIRIFIRSVTFLFSGKTRHCVDPNFWRSSRWHDLVSRHLDQLTGDAHATRFQIRRRSSFSALRAARNITNAPPEKYQFPGDEENRPRRPQSPRPCFPMRLSFNRDYRTASTIHWNSSGIRLKMLMFLSRWM